MPKKPDKEHLMRERERWMRELEAVIKGYNRVLRNLKKDHEVDFVKLDALNKRREAILEKIKMA